MDSSKGRELTQQVHRSTGAYELVLSPLILGLIGFALDRWFGTTPVLTVLFVVAGLIGASTKIYFTYKADMEQHEATGPWVKRQSQQAAAPLSGNPEHRGGSWAQQ